MPDFCVDMVISPPPCREGLGVGLLVDFIVYSRGSLNVVDELVLHIY